MDSGKTKIIVQYDNIHIRLLTKESGREYGDSKEINEKWENHGNVRKVFYVNWAGSVVHNLGNVSEKSKWLKNKQ